MSIHYPKLTVRSERPETIFTTVELDGQQIPATRVAFDTGKDVSGLIRVRLEFYATLDAQIAGVPLALTSLGPDPMDEAKRRDWLNDDERHATWQDVEVEVS